MSLFTSVGGELPADGDTLTPNELCCDPASSLCKTPLHVWETKCHRCGGSGVVNTTGRKGRRGLGTCMACSGLGFVRHISADSTSHSEVYTLNREESQELKCVRSPHPWDL